jgi:hypothetical protein
MRRPAGGGTTTMPYWPGASLSGSPRTSGCSWRSRCTTAVLVVADACRRCDVRRDAGADSRRRAVRALRRARRVEGGQGRQLPVVVSPRARPSWCAAGGRRGGAASACRCRRGGLHVKTFAGVAEEQAALAGAARRLVATQARHPAADGRVLVSEDGVRVALEWRWRGETTARLLRMARSCGRPWMTTRSSCVPRRSTRGCTGSSPPLEGASERTTVSPRRPCRPPVEARGSRRSGPGTRAPAGTTRRA